MFNLDFNKNKLNYIVFSFIVVTVCGFFAKKWQQSFLNKNDEYDMIRKYLLVDSPLYGHNLPKLWIHTKYEVNSRKWKDFYSRNTTDLNEPYIHLTIKTIIDHCANDFNICLIDDQSFSKLLPSWDVDLSQLAEPMKSNFRELGLLELVYFYGGMVVPNSFLCLKNMKSFYDNGVSGNRPFVCENINRTANMVADKHKMLFLPDLYLFGAKKNDATILELIEYLKQRNQSPHFTAETEFLGDSAHWCMTATKKQKMNLVGGEMVGVKTNKRSPILLENLMEEEYLDLHSNAVGIFIPNDEILKRPKFQWFAVYPAENLVDSRMIISKYLMASIVDANGEYNKDSTIRTVVSL